MLRQVCIVINDEIIYQRKFAKSLDDNLFNTLYPTIKQHTFSKYKKDIGHLDFFSYRISYIVERDLNLTIIFVSGLTDEFERVKQELFKFKKDFIEFFGDNLSLDDKSLFYGVLDPFVFNIHKNMMPKISLIGFSGVGKTTITSLIRSQEIPMKHIPTITGDVATIKIGNLHFFLWDFAGQEQFSFLWNKFIRESDAVLLITDSTLENLEKSKFFLNLIGEEAPDAHCAIIANKQDLQSVLDVEAIENMMGLKTYSMIAIEPENKIKMIRIIADVLEMDPDVSPLLKPLFEREKLIQEAQNAINERLYQKAVVLFDKIGDLCMEIGDDSLGIEFKQKSEKLNTLLKSQ